MMAMDPLLLALVRLDRLGDLSESRWGELLRRARIAKLEARIARDLETCGLLSSLAPPRRDRLTAAISAAIESERQLLWEVDRIERALAPLGIFRLYLKGAAYAIAGLPPSRGRFAGDVDVMVPKDALGAVQEALERFGWKFAELDPYDERYYRKWTHELPPMHHRERHTFVDVHHTILPPTSRRKPDPELLWRAAVPVGGGRYVLAPTDLVLHSAAHLFHDGEIMLALRDLVDIRDLLVHFGADPGFWPALVPRATALDLGRPLYYALRYAERLLGLAVPREVEVSARRLGPPTPIVRIMDALVPRCLVPPSPASGYSGRGFAGLLLYMRSHWLRMPPYLLAAHLGRKALMRLSVGSPDQPLVQAGR